MQGSRHYVCETLQSHSSQLENENHIGQTSHRNRLKTGWNLRVIKVLKPKVRLRATISI